jgi:hypothetical protein
LASVSILDSGVWAARERDAFKYAVEAELE